MDVIYFLIPLALVLLVAAVWAFFWAVKNDQFDDLDREANRILFDEDMLPRNRKPAQSPSPTQSAPPGNTTPDNTTPDQTESPKGPA